MTLGLRVKGTCISHTATYDACADHVGYNVSVCVCVCVCVSVTICNGRWPHMLSPTWSAHMRRTLQYGIYLWRLKSCIRDPKTFRKMDRPLSIIDVDGCTGLSVNVMQSRKNGCPEHQTLGKPFCRDVSSNLHLRVYA